jgi:hypothetical protein
VDFDIGSGTGTTPSSVTGGIGTNITLPGGAGFSYAGYTFAGWSKTPNPDPATDIDYPIGGLTYTSATASTVTLYAVYVPVDKTALGSEITTVDLKKSNIHEENYAAEVYQAFTDAYNAAQAVYADTDATQAQTDAALAALRNAYGSLVQIHPALKHSHDTALGGKNHLTEFGQAVAIEFRGDIRDVTGFVLNGKDYPLTSGGTNIYNIMENGNVVGTITEGSAIVTFPAAFADRLTNGTHTFEVRFTDATGTGGGKAELVVNRQTESGGNGGNGNDPDAGPAITPPTGDDVSLELMLVILFASLGGLLVLIGVFTRRKKRRGRHARA